jgi:hypothetical protein
MMAPASFRYRRQHVANKVDPEHIVPERSTSAESDNLNKFNLAIEPGFITMFSFLSRYPVRKLMTMSTMQAVQRNVSSVPVPVLVRYK